MNRSNHGPPSVCKLVLIQMTLFYVIRLEHYSVFIYVLLSFLPPVFLQISFERRKLQSHDVWTPSTTWRFRPDGKSIQPLRRHTKSNITMGLNVFRLRTAASSLRLWIYLAFVMIWTISQNSTIIGISHHKESKQ